mmetsp:Transcript_19625/g.61058  ORF Transcript_19625/g.61058 Transcript_19625/m.61058 type:complete len:247 (-) Transcript_19625:378-1118(-)
MNDGAAQKLRGLPCCACARPARRAASFFSFPLHRQARHSSPGARQLSPGVGVAKGAPRGINSAEHSRIAEHDVAGMRECNHDRAASDQVKLPLGHAVAQTKAQQRQERRVGERHEQRPIGAARLLSARVLRDRRVDGRRVARVFLLAVEFKAAARLAHRVRREPNGEEGRDCRELADHARVDDALREVHPGGRRAARLHRKDGGVGRHDDRRPRLDWVVVHVVERALPHRQRAPPRLGDLRVGRPC